MVDQLKQNRRSFMSSAMERSLAAVAAVRIPASAEAAPLPALLEDADPIRHYWDRPFSELVDIGQYSASPPELERHRIYANLVLALLHGYFNSNKKGETGEYPWSPQQRIAGTGTQSLYQGGRYLGHNICCIAVDGDGEIVDFDFNHNTIFNSSVEHAEARLIKRLFSLADIHQDWDSAVGMDNRWNLSPQSATAPLRGETDADYGRSLANVTIYTSLESCAQCSGIMALANVKQVVFLQPDPSQYMIGRIMYRLSRPVGQEGGSGAPRPISGSELGMTVTDGLADDYAEFRRKVGKAPGQTAFYKPPGSEYDPAAWSASASITSFLCTDLAFARFQSGRAALDAMTLTHGGYRPEGLNILSNAEVLRQARQFLNYALTEGRRGTPHR